MGNVFDYLNWRDDIILDDINEADILILNHVSYFPLEFLMEENEYVTLKEIYQRSFKKKNLTYYQEDEKLIKALSTAPRYQNLYIGNLSYKLDEKKEEQFLGITIYLPNNRLFISFRGTSNELFAWKEDFNMSYMITPAQKDALKYLNHVSKFKRIYVSGHSKGGNLAMYAAIHANPIIRRHIIKVYNYDGPGFFKLTKEYYNFHKKIVTYTPSDSIIGSLLYQDNETIYIKSNNHSIMQHDVYSWIIDKKSFVREKVTKDSIKTKKIIDQFFINYDIDKRKRLIDELFFMIEKTGVKNVQDLRFRNVFKIIMSYRYLKDDEKKFLLEIIKYFINQNKNIKMDVINNENNN